MRKLIEAHGFKGLKNQMEADIIAELREPGFLGLVIDISETDYTKLSAALKEVKRILSK